MASPIDVQQQGAVLAVTLDAPDGNALTNEALAELAGVLASAAASGCSVVTLRGRGADFCAGRSEPPRPSAPPTPEQLEAVVTRPVLDVFAALERVPVPVVAAVQGRAWGLACALAGAADVTIAAEDASFRLPEMERDLPPTLATSVLHRIVARKTLIELVYSSREIDGREAVRVGIATRAVPSGELDAATEETLRTIAGRDRRALVAVKSYLRNAPQLDPVGAASLGSITLAGVLATQARERAQQ